MGLLPLNETLDSLFLFYIFFRACVCVCIVFFVKLKFHCERVLLIVITAVMGCAYYCNQNPKNVVFLLLVYKLLYLCICDLCVLGFLG
jgi:hypothetical protein